MTEVYDWLNRSIGRVTLYNSGIGNSAVLDKLTISICRYMLFILYAAKVLINYLKYVMFNCVMLFKKKTSLKCNDQVCLQTARSYLADIEARQKKIIPANHKKFTRRLYRRNLVGNFERFRTKQFWMSWRDLFFKKVGRQLANIVRSQRNVRNSNKIDSAQDATLPIYRLSSSFFPVSLMHFN